MKNTYTVSQVNSYIKNMFTQDFMLRSINIKGEISNVKYHSSGHIYFTIKDEGSAIKCVMFLTYRKGLAFKLSEGQQVIVNGSVDVYERDGNYQLYAKSISLDGLGALYERFDRLKKELSEMGMFDSSYKQEIPAYVKKVGIVTAKTGAAIQDIINISSRRNPYVQLVLYPARVQGEGAAGTIVRGIKTLEKTGVDLIIVGRGGGSIEDLWAFNEEEVARAIFDCRIPVISAVGHETDITISDFVADLRAPTPSAAAELAVFSIEDFDAMLEGLKQRLQRAMKVRIDQERDRVYKFKLRLKNKSAESRIREKRMFLASGSDVLYEYMMKALSNKKHALEIYKERLSGLSPLKRLKSGYALVEKDGKILGEKDQVAKGDRIMLRLADKDIKALVEEVLNINREG
ncbi:MAG: exodeoxyribonuclease VII large subunit [Lachnospiraceae bacterium]|nr:exodeoxyribonuclease VII large subunit [Lachnospiraceae bacterium]